MIASQDPLLIEGKKQINQKMSKSEYSSLADPFTIIHNYRTSFTARQGSREEAEKLQIPSISPEIIESLNKDSRLQRNRRRSVSKNKTIHKFRNYTSKRQIRQRYINFSQLQMKIQLWRQLWIPNRQFSELRRQKKKKNYFLKENQNQCGQLKMNNHKISEICKELAQKNQIYQIREVIDDKNDNHIENQNSLGFWNLHEIIPDYI